MHQLVWVPTMIGFIFSLIVNICSIASFYLVMISSSVPCIDTTLQNKLIVFNFFRICFSYQCYDLYFHQRSQDNHYFHFSSQYFTLLVFVNLLKLLCKNFQHLFVFHVHIYFRLNKVKIVLFHLLTNIHNIQIFLQLINSSFWLINQNLIRSFTSF